MNQPAATVAGLSKFIANDENGGRLCTMERPGRRRKSTSTGRAPVQLALFPEAVSLCRIRPECNEWRYYRMEVLPDLFGGALLMRQWGRIGTAGTQRFDMYLDAGAAVNALAVIAHAKIRS